MDTESSDRKSTECTLFSFFRLDQVKGAGYARAFAFCLFIVPALWLKPPSFRRDRLVDVDVPRVFTPNGDNINETLTITYKLREVTDARPVQLQIYNLAGALITQLPALTTRSGTFTQQWDGRDAQDILVRPGTYVYKLTLDSEEQHTKTGAVAVAY
jgi:gliding motility-associated-like protein